MWGRIQQLFLTVNTDEEKEKVRVTKVGGRGNYVGSWPKFPDCSQSAILLFGYCSYYKWGPSGLRSFGSFAREDANSKWTQNSQNVFLGHMRGKWMQLNHPETKGELKVWPCVAVWGMRGHSPPEIKMLVFLSRFRHFGCYLKQEFSEEALNWRCPFKWPAWCHRHHLLVRQESLQAQVEVLFRSGAFFTHFSQPVQVNMKICSAVTQAVTFSTPLSLVNEICSYSLFIFNLTS